MAILGKERFEDLEVIHEGITGMLEIYQEDPASRGLNAYFKAFTKLVENLCRPFDDQQPVVWYNLGMSPELILALDGVHNLPIEAYPALQNIVGDVNFTLDYIDRAEAHGLPPEVCSVDKSGVGAILKGLMPKPACILGVNTPCDSQIAALSSAAEISGAPIFLIDIPYLYGERDIEYVARQIRDAIPFLEKHTGRKFSWERFREICLRANQMSENLLAWNEYRKAVPCPQISKLICLMVPLFITFAGTETGVVTAAELAAEAREKSERGESAVPGGEKIRAVWYQDPVWFDLQFYDWMESELKMVIPMDLFGYHAPEGMIDVSSRESMIRGLAHRFIRVMPMSRQFKGPIEWYLNDYVTLCREYKADFGIFAGHVACKHAWGGLGLLKEKCREIGMPLLVFEFDMFDPRVTPVESIQDQITQFVNNVVLPRMESKKP
jgi:benzoyl-CoA reductase/2-hydroxyglutaryl-CoA dehydratase subunit BcrC/BadD/HgdB